MSQRQAVTKARARASARAEWAKKTMILDELVELTGWHRDYARAALHDALSLTHRRSPRFTAEAIPPAPPLRSGS